MTFFVLVLLPVFRETGRVLPGHGSACFKRVNTGKRCRLLPDVKEKFA